jgi:RNase P/RNase MRP subunit p30
MIDYVYPDGNEEGFLNVNSDICFIYDDYSKIKKKGKVGFHTRKKGVDLVVLRAKNVREQMSKANIIVGVEDVKAKDYMHHRNSGLNHVLCKIAKEKGIKIGFSFSDLLNADKKKRAILLGRMKQNVRLCRKYKVEMVFGSFARKPEDMRDVGEIKRLITC